MKNYAIIVAMRKLSMYLILPLSLVVLEIMLRLTSGMGLAHEGLASALLIALAYGFFFDILCSLFRKRKPSFWLGFLFLELCTVWFLIGYFTDNTYSVFMSPAMIFGEAGDVVNNFGSTLVTLIRNGWPMILLYHIPAVLMLLFSGKISLRARKRGRTFLILTGLIVLCFLCSSVLNAGSELLSAKRSYEYSYDGSVRAFGLLDALNLNLSKGFSGSAEPALSFDPVAAPLPDSPASADTPAEEDPAVNYGVNALNLDFAALSQDSSRSDADRRIDAYLSSLMPASKNKYTGIFQGKNLILICAEAFSKEVIDEERTPALYRLASGGIQLEDYYQPFWGGSTSTGEYSFLTGIIPTRSDAMALSIGHNMYFTMGNQLQRQGYFSRAYHNGDMFYYSRNQTHPNLGYSKYIARNSGMENAVSEAWPPSDLEMFDYIAPGIVGKSPFSVYVMTFSGHCNYAYNSNAMSYKNREFGESLPFSDTVNAYLAANQELEYALEHLLSSLEEAGIADDTVICLTSDHYPYGLQKSSAWDNKADHLQELYGFAPDSNPARDHSSAIIWCGCLEKGEPITVSAPCSSIDLLPTLSNLFGLEYDSRMLAGRDVFSDAEPLVVWNDRSWLTERGYYDGETHQFTPADGFTDDPAYTKRINSLVTNKMAYSEYVVQHDYYKSIFGTDDIR